MKEKERQQVANYPVKGILLNHKIQNSDEALKPYILKYRKGIKVQDSKSVKYHSIVSQIHKSYKNIITDHTNKQNWARKYAFLCAKEGRRLLQNVSKSELFLTKNPKKDSTIAQKRENKDFKRKLAKEEADKRKKEMEKQEEERQARKLDFLINQTELYSHFVLNKNKMKEEIPKNSEINDEYSLEKAREMALDAAKKQTKHAEEFSVTDADAIKEQPKMLNAQLKEYQLKGLKWLGNLYNQGINGILADDMGLGKTIQSISLLAYLYESKKLKGPFLIVTPTSTLPNWASELERFVPEFSVLKFWGTDRKKSKFNKFNVVLTSYAILLIDEKIFNKTKWQYMILDEAQAIKSSKSQRWNKLLKIPCRNRLLLTGTPIQNNLKELWSLLHFIMPSLFDSVSEFEDWFLKMNSDRLERLHVILKPFMLRREKKDVASELKEKLMKVIFTDLTFKQRVFYDKLEKRLPLDFQDTEVANVLMHYRKVCNHPDLFHKAEVETPVIMKDEDFKPVFKKEVPVNFLKYKNDIFEQQESLRKRIKLNEPQELEFKVQELEKKAVIEEFKSKVEFNNQKLHIPTTFYKKVINQVEYQSDGLIDQPTFTTNERTTFLPEKSNFTLDSGKLATLDLLLSKLKQKNHRPLIYFQMTKMMNIMEEYLTSKKYSYLRLDGSTKLSERKDLVHKWQTENIFIFLLSTRAGGLGINLTAADTVIFYDSDWNPTVDKQAMDRAHRLGQLRDVTVYKLVCKGTVEEKVMEMASKKDEIQKMVIEKGDFEGGDI